MFVGVGRITLQIPGARSLKDKRMVTRSFRERVLARLHVSVAEVSGLAEHQRAVFGVAGVSNEAAVCDEQLANVTRFAGQLRDAVLVDVATEILPFGEGARSLVPSETLATLLPPTDSADEDDENHG